MSGRELNQDESLGRNADSECAVAKCKVLWRERLACCAELSDLIASWERRAAHCIIGFDDVSVICVQAPDLHWRIGGDAGEFYAKCF